MLQEFSLPLLERKLSGRLGISLEVCSLGKSEVQAWGIFILCPQTKPLLTAFVRLLDRPEVLNFISFFEL